MLDNLKRYNIVLASNSPRRRDLLAGLGIEFEVRVLPGIDESYPDSLPANEIPLYIAAKKAEANRKEMRQGDLVITADTVVVCDGKALGKPADAAEAPRPSLRALGLMKYSFYATALTLLHCVAFFALEMFSFFHWLRWLECAAGSTLVTVLLVLTIEGARKR